MASPNELIKPHLHALCLAYVQERMDAIQAAINAAQESANSETKSSAGDKYETGRAMAQNERDRNLVQLQQARQLLAELLRIDPALPCDAVRPGALVQTSMGWFYLGVSAGKLLLEGTDYFAVSAAAPVAAALAGKRAGESAAFNGKTVLITAVS
ncbi:3-oxoacyl-ACP synthase [Hymenobacter psychrophilus]|uniref:Transcription elongation factor, GreA/GreB family n=1 Tax=Hymenobacter psychrophilus TaxID=651662 RepID=A0A1H3H1L3_9BACT|nr:3-oxoacyl-ACP synthase [Hymenobacter psychrophilus]SDY09351.1 Transcription elongation factor, GreA/GreB family [Hymenobacter psychrophilus]